MVTSVWHVDRKQNRGTGADEMPNPIRSVSLTTNANFEQWIQRFVAAFITVEQLRIVWQIHIDSNCGINI
jgi:hypothetical protein